MTSPCSVTLTREPTLPGGWARIARLTGPPPRPSEPPRPWKSVSRTSLRAAHSARAAWASYRSRVADSGPTSFAESEYPSITSTLRSSPASRCAGPGAGGAGRGARPPQPLVEHVDAAPEVVTGLEQGHDPKGERLVADGGAG